MVITEMGSAHMPVKVFRLQVEREHIGQNGVQRPGDVPGRLGVKVG